MKILIIFTVVMAIQTFWVIGVPDIQALRRQSAAKSFHSVPDRIVASDISPWTGRKVGVHYGAAFNSKYTVNGRGYRCQR